MGVSLSGGVYYTNLKKLKRLRPKYRPNGNRRQESTTTSRSGLIWSNATMTWAELTETWNELT